MNKRHFLLLYIFCLCACSRQKGGAIIDLTDIGQNEIVVPAESIYHYLFGIDHHMVSADI